MLHVLCCQPFYWGPNEFNGHGCFRLVEYFLRMSFVVTGVIGGYRCVVEDMRYVIGDYGCVIRVIGVSLGSPVYHWGYPFFIEFYRCVIGGHHGIV